MNLGTREPMKKNKFIEDEIEIRQKNRTKNKLKTPDKYRIYQLWI